MKLKTIRLPSKLSALILVALDDLARVERSKKYTVDMDDWHVPNGTCAVCFAGSVMTRKLDPSEKVIDGRRNPQVVFDTKTVHKFFALNAIRDGFAASALEHMGMEYCEAVDKVEPAYNAGVLTFPTYAKDRLAWKRGMRKMAKWLDARGL